MPKANKRAAVQAVSPPGQREPTAAEAEAISEARSKQARRPTRVEIAATSTGAGVMSIAPSHADAAGWAAHLNATLGTRSSAFADSALRSLANAAMGKDRQHVSERTNAALALMGGIAPADELEAAIGVQIVTAHFAALDFTERARLNAGEYPQTAAAYANMATKLSRTMTAHVEALSKLRTGGKQQVEVRYVYVDARGGQNIIGSHIGGGAPQGNVGQPHAPDTIARLAAEGGLPMWREDPQGLALPVAGDPRQEAVPVARGQEPRRTDRPGERQLHVREVDA